MLGLSQSYVPKIANALETVKLQKQPLIWLNGASCAGCTISFANTNYPSVSELILDTLSVKYNETLMAASGEVADKALEDAIGQFKGKYIMVLEGAVPTKNGGVYLRVAGKPFVEKVKKVAANAAYCVAMGTCASFGGIPAASPNPTGCKGLKDVGGTVVNIPGCPAHPDWLVGIIVNMLLFRKIPNLDKYGRPQMFYRKLVHDSCPRRGAYEQGQYIEQFGVELDGIEGCMGAKGCRGPVASADCPSRLWNSGTSFCISASTPCVGCVEPDFPQSLLYEPIPQALKEVRDKEAVGVVDTIGAGFGVAVTGAAATAGALYLARKKAKQRASRNEGA